jgi:phosphatidylethanolamine-binding protein (PEBP) family uncharacterized protein
MLLYPYLNLEITMKHIFAPLAILLCSTSISYADMSLSFKWGNIPKCTNGNPNKVSNPEFIVKGVPKGTTKIIFKLKDNDAPNYNHGGGTVKVGTSGKIVSGAFKYKSPCPPSGVHTYVWTATAKAGNKTVARAKASRKYPE